MCGASGTARTRAPSRPRPCSRRPRTATRPRPCLIAPPAEPDRGPTSLRPRRAMLGPGRRRLGPVRASSARRRRLASLVRYLPPARQQGAAGGGNHGSTQARRCEPRCTVLPLRRTRWYPGMPPARAPYLALISRAPGACALIICVRTSPGVSPCPMCMGSVCRTSCPLGSRQVASVSRRLGRGTDARWGHFRL